MSQDRQADKRRWALAAGAAALVSAAALLILLFFLRGRDAPSSLPGSGTGSVTAAAAPRLSAAEGAAAAERSPAGEPSLDASAARLARGRWSRAAVAQRREQWQRRRDAVRQARERRQATQQQGSRAAGRLDPQLIRDEMRALFPLLRECYENAMLDAGPALQGKLVLKYVIAGEQSVGGIIEEVEIDEERSDPVMRDNPSLVQCVTETAYTMEFDVPPRGGGIVTVSYPIVFTPGDDD